MRRRVRTKEEMEAALSAALRKLIREQMDERAQTALVRIIGDAVIARFGGVMSAAEKVLSRERNGLKLIKELKEKLSRQARPLMAEVMGKIIDAEVTDVHSSFSPQTDERVEVIIFNKDLETVYPALKSRACRNAPR